ncbi:MAG TPA: beta-galactosidase [Ktedonobacteraceae bacterium]|jgi:endo-1,4-beta-mannosidase|nr:beta-galactosidase [Ktedonobacteraceae bacterium]
MQQDTFTLGVNYWPRKKAMYWWKDFDRSEVEQEFAEIAALKLHVARIFLFWEDFQPAPDRVNDRALADLGIVLDVAHQAGIKIMPTFFTGHMSGINWWPVWALTNQEDPGGMLRIAGGEFTARLGRDPYADPFMLEAERRLVKAVCERYGSHPALFSWNFSNEPDLFFVPQQYRDSAAWNQMLANEVRKYSDRPISAGMHLPTLTRYNGFRPDLLAPNNTFLSMHAYSIYYPLTEISDPLNSDVVPLACLVTEGLGGKRVLLEEFGYASSEKGDISEHKMVRRGPAESRQFFADDASGGRYYREVLDKLAQCGSLGALGWMFSDYDPCLWSKPPFDTHEHERFFGLTRYDGTVKPSGEAMRAFSERVALGNVPARTVDPLRLDPTEWYRAPGEHFDRLFQEFQEKSPFTQAP